MSDLYFSVTQEPPNTQVLAAVGEIDVTNCDELAEALEKQLDSSGRVVIDLNRCSHFDSYCLNVLVRFAKKQRKQGREFSVRMDQRGQRILELRSLAALLGLETAGTVNRLSA
jgi:anti-anti-sigma factor